MALAATVVAQPPRLVAELARRSLSGCLAVQAEPGPGHFPALRFPPQAEAVEAVDLLAQLEETAA